jgi:acetyl-CoA carboxylase carboxyltransferase component
MGPEGACSIIFKQKIQQLQDHEKKRTELAEQYRLKFANSYIAASKGYIDDVIEPSETRTRLIAALRAIIRKREERRRRNMVTSLFRSLLPPEKNMCCS